MVLRCQVAAMLQYIFQTKVRYLVTISGQRAKAHGYKIWHNTVAPYGRAHLHRILHSDPYCTYVACTRQKSEIVCSTLANRAHESCRTNVIITYLRARTSTSSLSPKEANYSGIVSFWLEFVLPNTNIDAEKSEYAAHISGTQRKARNHMSERLGFCPVTRATVHQ